MIKKILIIGIILGISIFLMIPSGAAPTDAVLDQQVELAIPGTFEMVDANHDRKAEALRFHLDLQAYREGNFIVTGNLEGMKSGQWVSLNTSVIPFQWSPDNRTIILTFSPDNILKYQIPGPYRITVGLKDGDWELPQQVVGFSPKYVPGNFSSQSSSSTAQGQISSVSKAKRAVETWASYKAMKLGKFLGISFNYDHWQVEYKDKFSPQICRFIVSPQGAVQLMKINPQ